MPKELEDQLREMEWPPKVKVGTEENPEEVQLTELDVTWALCTMLGMRWNDAVSIQDDIQVRFLYNKAMQVAHDSATSAAEAARQRDEYEKKVDESLSRLTGTDIQQNVRRPPQL